MIKTIIMETPATYAYLNLKDTIDHKLVATSEELQLTSPVKIFSSMDIVTKNQAINDQQLVEPSEEPQSAHPVEISSSGVLSGKTSIPRVRVFKLFHKCELIIVILGSVDCPVSKLSGNSDWCVFYF